MSVNSRHSIIAGLEPMIESFLRSRGVEARHIEAAALAWPERSPIKSRA